MDAAVAETRRIVSVSEAIARQLRSEMDGRGGELSDRRRAAMEGMAVRRRATVGATRSCENIFRLGTGTEELAAVLGKMPLFVLVAVRGIPDERHMILHPFARSCLSRVNLFV